MQTCYMDNRPKAPPVLFSMVPEGNGYVRLKNVDTGRTTLCPQPEFNKNYEPIRW